MARQTIMFSSNSPAHFFGTSWRSKGDTKHRSWRMTHRKPTVNVEEMALGEMVVEKYMHTFHLTKVGSRVVN